MAIDNKILLVLSEPLEICREPFSGPAARLGLREKELLAKLRGLKRIGIVRRIGAVISHRAAGFCRNALVAWKIDKSRAEDVGKIFALLPEVSHCYQRKKSPEWPYSIYTMIHAKTEKEKARLIKKMAREAGTNSYVVLDTLMELKKTKQDIEGIWA